MPEKGEGQSSGSIGTDQERFQVQVPWSKLGWRYHWVQRRRHNFQRKWALEAAESTTKHSTIQKWKNGSPNTAVTFHKDDGAMDECHSFSSTIYADGDVTSTDVYFSSVKQKPRPLPDVTNYITKFYSEYIKERFSIAVIIYLITRCVNSTDNL